MALLTLAQMDIRPLIQIMAPRNKTPTEEAYKLAEETAREALALHQRLCDDVGDAPNVPRVIYAHFIVREGALYFGQTIVEVYVFAEAEEYYARHHMRYNVERDTLFTVKNKETL